MAALILLIGLCALVRWASLRTTGKVRLVVGRLAALILLTYAVEAYAQIALRHAFHWRNTLPLQLCDLTLAGCILALAIVSRPAFEIAYYWGLTGALPALITPDLRRGFPTADFFNFFVGHGLILLALAWLISPRSAIDSRALRPGWPAAIRAYLYLNGYILLVGCLDWLFGWNYGYLRAKPYRHTLLDHFGPWPWYVFTCEGVALAAFTLLTLPFLHPQQGTGD